MKHVEIPVDKPRRRHPPFYLEVYKLSTQKMRPASQFPSPNDQSPSEN
jgi:hypothetical protein